MHLYLQHKDFHYLFILTNFDTMDSFGKALLWIEDNVQVFRKSDSNLNKACVTPTSARRCASYNSIPNETGACFKTDQNNSLLNNGKDKQTETGASKQSDNNDSMLRTEKDLQGENVSQDRKTKGNELTVQTALANTELERSSLDNNGEKLSPCVGSEPVSPFEYKTLVVIPPSQGLSGAKVAEIKPNPVCSVQPPVALGIVRSSTTRLNEISPPCPVETDTACKEVKTHIDIFNQRRLKAKSVSFTGVENFKQKPPKIIQRTNSAALIKIPENNTMTDNHSGLLKPEFNIRKTVSDSEAMGDIDNRYTVPENRLGTIDNYKSYLSVYSATSTKRDSEDRTSLSSYASMRRSNVMLKSVSTHDDALSMVSRKSSSGATRSSYGVDGRSPSPRHKSQTNDFIDLFRDDSYKTVEVKKSPRKIEAIMKAFGRGNYSNNESRLSLFSMKSRKRFKRDKMYRQDKASISNSPQLTFELYDDSENKGAEDVISTDAIEGNENKRKIGTLKKQISFSELHMRSAQLQLFKNNVSKPDFAAFADDDLGRIQFIVLYLNSNQTLRVSNLKAIGIQRPAQCSKSTQLFAKLGLKPGKFKTISSNKIPYADNPEFQQEFDFSKVTFKAEQCVRLKISIYKKDAFLSFPKCIGKTYAPLENCDLHVGKPMWKILRPKSWKVCMS